MLADGKHATQRVVARPLAIEKAGLPLDGRGVWLVDGEKWAELRSGEEFDALDPGDCRIIFTDLET